MSTAGLVAAVLCVAVAAVVVLSTIAWAASAKGKKT